MNSVFGREERPPSNDDAGVFPGVPLEAMESGGSGTLLLILVIVWCLRCFNIIKVGTYTISINPVIEW
jgi:hypothetical protein